MIGEIRTAITPYFDVKTNQKTFKGRPILIISHADTQDYVVLPVSTITRRNNIDPTYDIEVVPSTFPKLNLNSVSYIRTHKQTVVHASEIGKKIGDLRKDYPDLFLEVLSKREQFSEEITRQALEAV